MVGSKNKIWNNKRLRVNISLTDALQLVDEFERFRDFYWEYYEIDPCYTYSTPGAFGSVD